jgi:hypothetical protein
MYRPPGADVGLLRRHRVPLMDPAWRERRPTALATSRCDGPERQLDQSLRHDFDQGDWSVVSAPCATTSAVKWMPARHAAGGNGGLGTGHGHAGARRDPADRLASY